MFIAACHRIKSWRTMKQKVIGLKSKKRSGGHLEFMEIIRKDSCFILQCHVFKSINNNLKWVDVCRPPLWKNLWKKLSGRFTWCLADLTRADTGFWYKPNFSVKSGIICCSLPHFYIPVGRYVIPYVRYVSASPQKKKKIPTNPQQKEILIFVLASPLPDSPSCPATVAEVDTPQRLTDAVVSGWSLANVADGRPWGPLHSRLFSGPVKHPVISWKHDGDSRGSNRIPHAIRKASVKRLACTGFFWPSCTAR